MDIIFALLGIVLSGFIIWRSTDGFELASDFLGRRLTKGIKGATINAIASSMPEFLSTLFFLFYLRKSDGFSGGLGITAGSAIFNILIIPFSIFVVVRLTNKNAIITLVRQTMVRDGIALIIITGLLAILINHGRLNWVDGMLLTAPYLIYIAWLFISHKKIIGKGENYRYSPLTAKIAVEDYLLINLEKFVLKGKSIGTANAWRLLSFSTLVMIIGTWLLVYSTDELGKAMDIPLIFISVILASAASSIPDTMISIRDARKGNYEDAFSNALGSNIFDISFALGFPLLLYTIFFGSISMDQQILDASFDIWFALLIITIGTMLIFITGNQFNTTKAIALALLYIGFLVFIYFEIILNINFLNPDTPDNIMDYFRLN
ncbi:MAG: sodium:calcium antiporter [Bacteroidales bacterium]|nr:sodium:calcium antiporter [Bacteroidales bacterium]